jgi:hypothetical protein
VSRNVDIAAVVLLLAGIALFSGARNQFASRIDFRKIAFTRCAKMVIVPPHVPSPPPIPHVRTVRD